ncbi:tyrosine-type recombinase/integrase [Oscillatoria laete-virens]|uniref:tyrosine-type recombinase/integrase n=1 Tax=unclassified Desertifilum TaxID=2621682 RepID=UPI00243E10FE|nr:site-specific integrase [Desertifilum sp.]MDA0211205.1 tyrosine-type recombinase/integrase [Cyanobacteria bacterium FC1]MDL5052048.1 tyrosine-type recombinase/integrase [Oscillatoria laete-virens NRMC-F 0139]
MKTKSLHSPRRGRTSNPPALLPTTDALLNAFADFCRTDVANGNAAKDTTATYERRIKAFVIWCENQEIHPALATKEEVKTYRRYLIEEKHQKPATLSLTLSVLRRFYACARERGLVKENPVEGVKPPRDLTDAAERITYLEEIELQEFLAAIPADGSLKSIRDKALLAIMALQGPRTVEMHRANMGDLVKQGLNWGLKVEGKGSKRTVPLRPDLAKLLLQYLEARQAAGELLEDSSPLFIAVGNRAGGQRLSRRGIRSIVDGYLEQAGLKYTQGRTLSAHSLRHTAATLGLRAGADLRQVQDLLGHKNPEMTAIYAHVGERYTKNPALGISVKV